MALVEEKSAVVVQDAEEEMNAPLASADFTVHTGNIRRCNHLQMQISASTQKEVVTALKCTMQCWKKHNKHDFVMQREVIGHPKLMSLPLPGNPMAKRVNVKLFILQDYEEGFVNKAVSGVEKAVGFANIDSLVAQMPKPLNQHEQMHQLQAVWQEMEHLHDYSLVKSLGVADMTVDQLAQLNTHAKVPASVLEVDTMQVGCCLPKELRAYAQEHNIRLVAHCDGDDILPKDQFQRVMTKVLKDQSAFTPVGEYTDGSLTPLTSDASGALQVDWTPLWVARYTVVDTERSVIDSIGYVIGGRYLV